MIFHRERVHDFKSATAHEENKSTLRLSVPLARVLPNHYVAARFPDWNFGSDVVYSFMMAIRKKLG